MHSFFKTWFWGFWRISNNQLWERLFLTKSDYFCFFFSILMFCVFFSVEVNQLLTCFYSHPLLSSNTLRHDALELINTKPNRLKKCLKCCWVQHYEVCNKMQTYASCLYTKATNALLNFTLCWYSRAITSARDIWFLQSIRKSKTMHWLFQQVNGREPPITGHRSSTLFGTTVMAWSD